MPNPQKSEVHAVTGDASGSPSAEGDTTATRQVTGAGGSPGGKVLVPDLHLNEVDVVRDDSDVGGPIVVKSDSPELQHLELPVDPFPTDRMPEIDPPVKD